MKLAPDPDPATPLFCLDSSAITHGANLPAGSCRTAPAVLDEFEPGGATRRRLDLLLAGGMQVVAPTDRARSAVDAQARATGAAGRLSAADRDVLAVCIDAGTRARLVSDDYTMLDVARRLGVATQTVATPGIGGTRQWQARCRGCQRAYAPARAGSACDVCGSDIALKRRGA